VLLSFVALVAMYDLSALMRFKRFCGDEVVQFALLTIKGAGGRPLRFARAPAVRWKRTLWLAGSQLRKLKNICSHKSKNTLEDQLIIDRQRRAMLSITRQNTIAFAPNTRMSLRDILLEEKMTSPIREGGQDFPP
jgi:hypothetical protein